jgi:hypothetical protein
MKKNNLKSRRDGIYNKISTYPYDYFLKDLTLPPSPKERGLCNKNDE